MISGPTWWNMTEDTDKQTSQRLDAAARIVADCRKNRTTLVSLPADARPATEAEGYAVQTRVLDLLGVSPDCWKVSASGPSGATAAPVFGNIFAQTPASATNVSLLEAEIALLLKKDLPSGPGITYSRDMIYDAVDAIAVAFELVFFRLTDPDLSFPERLADGLASDGAVIGTRLPKENLLDRPVDRMALFKDGHSVPFTPTDIDPIASVQAYANHGGHPLDVLKSGRWILTGSMIGLEPAAGPSEWKAVWNGETEVSLSCLS
ncbi:MAG: hypothetical protein HWE23_14300 [Rhodobacteraceae bacterium]|nr:hypothetical protein [Paracoccaceae bacterium]